MIHITYGTYGTGIWFVLAFIIAVIAGLVIYFTFLNKKSEGKYEGFIAWIRDFLLFRKMIIEDFLKIIYLISAIFITLASFGLIRNFLAFIITLVVGNVMLRVMYELLLVIIVICRNTTEINKKLDKKEITDIKVEKVAPKKVTKTTTKKTATKTKK